MKLLKRIIAVAMAMSLTLLLAACSDTSWVYDYSGKKVSSGLYIAFTMEAYASAGQQEGLDEKITDIFKQTIEGKKAKDWMIEEAKTLSDSYMAIEMKFEELGLTMSEKDINEVNQAVKTAWPQYEELYLKNGVNEKTYKAIIENSKKRELVFNKYYGTDGIEAVSDDNLLVHYKENFASINAFQMPLIQPLEETLTDEDKKANEELKATADNYVKMFNDGEKTFNELSDMNTHAIDETTHDDAAEDDVIEKDEETKQLLHKTKNGLPEAVVKSIFDEMKPDEKAKVIADEKYYYFVVRYDVTKDTTKFEEMKATILTDIKGEDFTKMVEEWGAALTSNANNSAVKRYNPKNIKSE